MVAVLTVKLENFLEVNWEFATNFMMQLLPKEDPKFETEEASTHVEKKFGYICAWMIFIKKLKGKAGRDSDICFAYLKSQIG